MKTALVFGATGGIGSATVRQLNSRRYHVVGVGRPQLDLYGAMFEAHKRPNVSSVIDEVDPDVIVNCAGVLEGDFTQVFDVNVASCWHIIQHYIQRPELVKPVSILLVGSTAYSGGRRSYPLYSASKAALHNLVQGCQEILADRSIKLSLLHPARVRTRMSEQLPKTDRQLTATQVARELVKMIKEPSQIKELNCKL
jgi:3-hydroxy acid dehydrogenase/malonic semialdehyde reductase